MITAVISKGLKKVFKERGSDKKSLFSSKDLREYDFFMEKTLMIWISSLRLNILNNSDSYAAIIS